MCGAGGRRDGAVSGQSCMRMRVYQGLIQVLRQDGIGIVLEFCGSLSGRCGGLVVYGCTPKPSQQGLLRHVNQKISDLRFSNYKMLSCNATN